MKFLLFLNQSIFLELISTSRKQYSKKFYPIYKIESTRLRIQFI